jgi:hypothetical protein
MHGNELPCNWETQAKVPREGRGRSEESRLHRGYRLDGPDGILTSLKTRGRFDVSLSALTLPDYCLEGSAKGGGNWLISDFILSELDRPTIESIKAKIGAGRIQLTLARDAWQGASRYDIVEHLIGGRRFLLSEIDVDLWRGMLIEAKGCLDPRRQFRGRAAQTVTLLNTG